jgi:uncharacterized protein YhaN
LRVERLDLLSYGHLRGQSLDLSSPPAGLTLVVGANEAGKSTTMRALVSLLFGIERHTTDDYGQGRESLKVGALLVENGTRLEVIRQGLARVPLVTPEGQLVAEADLSALLGNIERSLFHVLFCIDHDELHERSEELLDADGEIGRLVFGASLGSTALSRVLQDLEGQAKALFKRGGSAQKIATSLSGARQLAKDARLARVRSRDWEREEQELQRLAQEVERMRVALTASRSEQGALCDPPCLSSPSVSSYLESSPAWRQLEWFSRSPGRMRSMRRTTCFANLMQSMTKLGEHETCSPAGLRASR